MDSSIITVLAIILLVLIVLNHITIISPTLTKTASCSQTNFGCCPNGVDSKINYYGTNCPGYRPGPGYYPSRYVPPPPPGPPLPPPPGPVPKPIGGCAGTRYGCCPNNSTPKINEQGSNCLLK
jgi:hypothetical protein